MPLVSILFGLILIALGDEGYTNRFDLFHVQKVGAPTALIPAGFGVALVLCGLIAFKSGARKHAMHIAAMVGLIGFVAGAAMGFRNLPAALQGTLDNPAAPKIQSAMGAVCGIFLALCVKSFIDARRRRRLAQGQVT